MTTTALGGLVRARARHRKTRSTVVRVHDEDVERRTENSRVVWRRDDTVETNTARKTIMMTTGRTRAPSAGLSSAAVRPSTRIRLRLDCDGGGDRQPDVPASPHFTFVRRFDIAALARWLARAPFSRVAPTRRVSSLYTTRGDVDRLLLLPLRRRGWRRAVDRRSQSYAAMTAAAENATWVEPTA